MTKEFKPLKYAGYSIVFQEVPNEITLAISISDCPYKCRGCHSDYLWEYTGKYIRDDIDFIIEQNKFIITCVCFMGGDQNSVELLEHLKNIKCTHRLKTCLYTGSANLANLEQYFMYLDYIKIGEYDELKGGLNSPKTNQRMYKIENNKIGEDITYLFQSKKSEVFNEQQNREI